jgi:hypothetical protein
LIASFVLQRLVNLIKSHLLIFTLISWAICILLRKVFAYAYILKCFP